MIEDEVIGLLSKLMSSRKNEETSNKRNFEHIYKYVNSELRKTIEDSGYSEKVNLISELNQILDNMKFLLDFPMFLGKTVIGILGTRRKYEYDFIADIFSKEINKLINSSVPSVIFENDVNDITAQNKLDCRISLSDKEYLLCGKLRDFNIDIRTIVDLFAIGVEEKFGNVVYVYIPFFSLNHTDEYKKLLSVLDCLIVCCSSLVEYEDRIRGIKSCYQGPVMAVPLDDDAREKLFEIEQNQKRISILSKHKVRDEISSNWNDMRNNLSFIDEIYMYLLGIQKFIYSQKLRQEKLISKINVNLLNLSDEVSLDMIREYKKLLVKEFDLSSERYAKIKKNTSELLDLVTKYEKELMIDIFRGIGNDRWECMLFHNEYDLICEKIAVALIEMKELPLARKYIHKLECRKYKNLNLLLAYLDYVSRDDKITSSIKIALLNADEDWLYDKLIVLFYKEIGISNDVVAQRLKYKRDYSSEENYFLGEYLSDKNWELAYQYFYNALKDGDIDAGSRILVLSNLRLNSEQLEEFADRLVPEANLIMGKNVIKNRYALGLRYLKIAAVLGNVEALDRVAALEYKRICGIEECNRVIYGLQKCIKTDAIKKNVNNILKMYLHLWEVTENSQYYEKIGVLYYLLSYYQKAVQYLSKSSSSISHFLLGIIYEHGYGVAIQLDMAMQEYSNSEIRESKAHYKKVKGKIEAQKEKKKKGNSLGDVIVSVEKKSRRPGFRLKWLKNR